MIKMKKSLPRLLALLLALLLPLSACAQTAVASFYPVWLIAMELTRGIDGVTVTALAPQSTGCLHDYQLATGDMKRLAGADILLINGAGMEAFLPMVQSAFPSLPIADASEGVALLTEDDTAAIGESETAVNAHIWLDPANCTKMAENLCAALCEAWPAHADALTANCADFSARLSALDGELREALTPLPRRDIITFHAAFPYFARAYDLQVVAVVNREPGEAISPAQLGKLVKLVRELNTPPLFVEPQYDDAAARTLARETGAAVWTLDPIVTGPEDETALGYYEQVMRANAAVLVQALGNGNP